MFKTDNNLYVFVGPTTGAFGHDVTTSAAATNEIHTVHEDGTASGVLAAGDLFKISQKDADGNVRSTPLLAWNSLTKSTGKSTDATTTEQSSVFGSTGSAGSINALNSNRYTVRVNFKNNTDLYSEQSDLHFFEYVSDASATQVEIANYFAQVMSKNAKFSGKASGKNRASVKVERVTDSTLTASTSGTIAVTNGSNQVTAATDIDDGGAAIVGGYLVLDSVAYKVVSISGQTATLDQPYQGATNSALGDGSTSEISAANAAAGNWGIKITGIAQEWKLGLTPYNQVTFDVTLDGFGATTDVATTAAVTAAGQGQKIAELEWFSQGSAGAPYRHGAVPSNADNITLVTDKDDFYDVIELKFDLADPKHAVAGAGAGKVTVVVALPDGVASADGTMGNDVFGFGSNHIFHE
jgi:hypothetical protein